MDTTEDREDADEPVAGSWMLDLHSGAAWRDTAHDRAFGYDRMDGEWTFDRFMAHVRPDAHRLVYDRYVESVELYRPWSFTCDVTRADGTPGRVRAFGDFLPGDALKPPRLTGFVLAVPSLGALEDDMRDAMRRLRAVDSGLHDALAAAERAARRQDGETRETVLRRLAEVARLAARLGETRSGRTEH